MTSTSIATLIQRGALFVVNHSGGKDSQAMFAKISKQVPAHQTIIIHAILPEVEWDGVIEHIKRTTGNVPLLFAKAKKTFFEMVEHRGMFPSPAYRQCTSDLKRNPIEREIRRFLKDNPSFGGLVVNCMGMLGAQDPPGARHRKSPLTFPPRLAQLVRATADSAKRASEAGFLWIMTWLLSAKPQEPRADDSLQEQRHLSEQ
jgi:hypothetical protein